MREGGREGERVGGRGGGTLTAGLTNERAGLVSAHSPTSGLTRAQELSGTRRGWQAADGEEWSLCFNGGELYLADLMLGRVEQYLYL